MTGEASPADDLGALRQTMADFFDRAAGPEVAADWRTAGRVPPSFWRAAGDAGLLGLSVPVAYGGHGGDFRHEAALTKEIYRRGLDAFAAPLHNAMIAPYFVSYGTEAQKRRWLPGICTGANVTAIAMTEPGAGSDLKAIRTTARRTGDRYLVTGQKTFISNGQTANLIVVACKTDPAAGARGVSLLVVETDKAQGFRRGRKLDKIGLEGADTSELFFDEVSVPAANLLGGDEGRGFPQLMEKLAQERLLIAIQALGTIERALTETRSYVKQRRASGDPLLTFQDTQFKLAECMTEARIAAVFVDHCIADCVAGRLDAATASMAKYWVTEAQGRIVDACLQLHGANGYLLDYPIAHMYRDSRVQRIYGGTNEIMKLLIARTI